MTNKREWDAKRGFPSGMTTKGPTKGAIRCGTQIPFGNDKQKGVGWERRFPSGMTTKGANKRGDPMRDADSLRE